MSSNAVLCFRSRVLRLWHVLNPYLHEVQWRFELNDENIFNVNKERCGDLKVHAKVKMWKYNSHILSRELLI